MSSSPVTGNLLRITTRHYQITVAIAEILETALFFHKPLKAILPAELLPTSREANMFATNCGHRTKGEGVLCSDN